MLLLILYPLLILALVGIAIYEHMTVTTLSLPISPALTILTILLPLLSPLTTLSTPYLFNNPSNRKPPSRTTTTTTTRSLTHLLPLLLQILQFNLTTILTTLFTTTTLPPASSNPSKTCLLASQWRALWTNHNAPAIRAIQDALGCCGFRSTRDMAWPFPHGQNPTTATCEVQFGRRQACLPAWEGAMRGVGAGEVGVVLCVGVVQVLSLFLAAGGGRGFGFGAVGSNEGGFFWGRVVERVFGGGNDRVRGEGAEEGRRPLLAAAPSEGDEEGGRVVETGYREVVDDEEVTDAEGEDRPGEGEAEQRRGPGGYGAVGTGAPRVEPAHHDPWAQG